jgi:serine/threonine protein kinase
MKEVLSHFHIHLNTENLKIADFGLAKKASFLQRRKSNTIVSLWYRAPEIILKSQDYLLGVDIWSVGCIFAEFFTMRPIFESESERACLEKIFKLLGSPTLDNCSYYDQFQSELAHYKLGSYAPPKYLSDFFPQIDNIQALDLLSKML